MRLARRHLALGSLIAAVATACVGDGQSAETSRCVQGQASLCVCESGLLGSQACQSDGTFASCVCAAAPEPRCVRGETALCACEDGRVGSQACQADGTFAACECACLPRSCEDLRIECGAADDGCGAALACGGCGARAECGQGQCRCNEGFTGDGHLCVPLDECAAGLHDCAPEATCTDATPGFVCTCPPGYVGDGRTCAPNECTLGTHDCAPHATCTDTPQGFTCSCDPGYAGDGRSCTVVVADLSATPVLMYLWTSPNLETAPIRVEVLGLSRIAWDVPTTSVPNPWGSTLPQWIPSGPAVYLPITFRGLRVAAWDGERLASLLTSLVGQDDYALGPLYLRGEGEEVLEVSFKGSVVSARTDRTAIGSGSEVLEEVVFQPNHVQFRWLHEAPQPAKTFEWGLAVEIAGITSYSTRPEDVDPCPLPAGLPLELRSVRRILNAASWIQRTVEAVEWQAEHGSGFNDFEVRRSGSVIAGEPYGDNELYRYNVYELWPSGVTFFDPAKPYGQTPLVDLRLTFDLMEAGN